MPAPLDDWQFYVVTAAALLAAWLVLRMFLPARRGAKGQSRRITLTIAGKRP